MVTLVFLSVLQIVMVILQHIYSFLLHLSMMVDKNVFSSVPQPTLSKMSLKFLLLQVFLGQID